MNGRAPPRAGPARRAVLRRRRGAAPPRASRRRVVVACSRAGTTRRSSRRSSTTRTCSPGQALAAQTYSFVGRDGSLLALRPDFTSLLAKIAAGRLADRPAPIRLYYSGEVLRYEPPKAGRQSELYQMGLEHLGGDARAADAEVLAIAAECLERAGRARTGSLALGHVGVFDGLWPSRRPRRRARSTALRERVEAKDAAGVREALARRRRAGAGGGGARAPRHARRATPRCSTRRSAPLAPLPAAAAALRRAARESSRRCAAAGLGAAPGHRPGRGARPRLLHRPRLPRLRAAASASRSAAAAATTRCSRASAGRCPPSASCSASTAWRCCSSGRDGSRRRAGRSGRSASAAATLGDGARAARVAPRAEGARVRFGERRAAMSLTVALSKGKLLAGAEALFRRAGLPFPEGEGRRLVVPTGRAALPVREGHGRADLRRVRRRRLRHRRAATCCSRRAATCYEPLDLGFGRCRLVVARPRGPRRSHPRRLDRARRHQVPAAWRPRTSWSAACRSRW